MTDLTTQTHNGIKVVLTAKNGNVHAFVKCPEKKLFIDAACRDGYAGKKIGWVAATEGLYNGKLQPILLTIPKDDYNVIVEEIKSQKIKKIESTETKIIATWGCDTANTTYVTGKGSLLITAELDDDFTRVICSDISVPKGCVKNDATTMSYGGWTATGVIAENIINEALRTAKERQVKREAENASFQDYLDTLCPICGSCCYGECDGEE